jgi:hypothetical protein
MDCAAAGAFCSISRPRPFANHSLKNNTRAGSKQISDFTKGFVDAIYAKLLVVEEKDKDGNVVQREDRRFANAAMVACRRAWCVGQRAQEKKVPAINPFSRNWLKGPRFGPSRARNTNCDVALKTSGTATFARARFGGIVQMAGSPMRRRSARWPRLRRRRRKPVERRHGPCRPLRRRVAQADAIGRPIRSHSRQNINDLPCGRDHRASGAG